MRLSKELEEKRQGLLRYCKIGGPTRYIGPGVVRRHDLAALLSEIDRLNKVVEEYAHCKSDCKSVVVCGSECTCGFSLAAELEARKEEE